MTDLLPCICTMAACCMIVNIMATFNDHSVASLHQSPRVHVQDPKSGFHQILGLGPKYYHQMTDYSIDVTDSEQRQGGHRVKRTGIGGEPSLSIVNPIEVLRQRLLLEMARRRLYQSEEKIQANRQFLKTIG